MSTLRDKIFRKADRTKFFNHAFLPIGNITSEDTPKGRFYTTPSGVFPSVTTVLGRYFNKEASLDKWRQKVGYENAARITYQAGVRGTSLHNICERYLRNEQDYVGGEMPVNESTFKTIQPYLDEHVGDIYGIELPLYSKFYKTAGRCDLLGIYNEQLSIVDFKTSLKVKKEEWIESYFCQETIYALMVEELYGIKVPQIVTLMAVDNNPPQVFVKDKDQFMEKVFEIFLL